MTRTLDELDATVHDVEQTHLSSFTGGRAPYPGHPAEERDEQFRDWVSAPQT